MNCHKRANNAVAARAPNDGAKPQHILDQGHADGGKDNAHGKVPHGQAVAVEDNKHMAVDVTLSRKPNAVPTRHLKKHNSRTYLQCVSQL